MSKLKMGLRGLTVPELVEKGREITGAMTGNVNYTTPVPALADVNDAIDALELAYNESRGRDKDKIAAMRLRKKELLFLLVQLASYVQVTSDGDEEKILSSGFEVVAPKTPRPDTAGAVTNLRLSDGTVPGRIKADWNKANDAVIYIIESSPTAEFVTSDLKGFTTRTQKEITGLSSGGRIWIRVIAVGRENPGTPSDASSILVK